MRALDENRYEQVVEKMKEVISAIYLKDDSFVPAQKGLVLCFAGRDAADEAASMILAVLLRSKGIDAQWISAEALAGELVDLVEAFILSIYVSVYASVSRTFRCLLVCGKQRLNWSKQPKSYRKRELSGSSGLLEKA